MSMENRLRDSFVRATDAALAHLGDVSEAIGRVRRTVQQYRSGERRVTEDAARRLVTYLRRRAGELTEAADELERALAAEEEK